MLYCGLYFAGIVVDDGKNTVAKASTMVRAGKKMKADMRAAANNERDERFMMDTALNE